MVIFGGLELLAAGYIIHKHSKNKREKQRLEEDAAILEEQQYHVQHRYPASHRRMRSDDRERPHDQEYPHDRRHPHEGRKPPREPRAQYLNMNTSQPQRANSAPPQGYPPAGWPANWEQSRYPPPNNAPNNTNTSASQYHQDPLYLRDPSQGGKSHYQQSDLPRGRSQARRSNGAADMGSSEQRAYGSHVAVPNDEFRYGDPSDPPPEYTP